MTDSRKTLSVDRRSAKEEAVRHVAWISCGRPYVLTAGVHVTVARQGQTWVDVLLFGCASSCWGSNWRQCPSILKSRALWLVDGSCRGCSCSCSWESSSAGLSWLLLVNGKSFFWRIFSLNDRFVLCFEELLLLPVKLNFGYLLLVGRNELVFLPFK